MKHFIKFEKNSSYIFVNLARPTDIIDDFRMDLGIQY